MSEASHFFLCPFPECPNKYTRKSNLKKHLIAIKAGGCDANHLQTDAQWADEYVQSLLLQARRQALPEEGRKAKRSARNTRYYSSHKQAILERSKARRNKNNAAPAMSKGT